MVVCLIRDRGTAGSSLIGVTALCPLARHINPSLVLVQPRKTRPYVTERLLIRCKESNKKSNILERDQTLHFFGPDLEPICLQRLRDDIRTVGEKCRDCS